MLNVIFSFIIFLWMSTPVLWSFQAVRGKTLFFPLYIQTVNLLKFWHLESKHLLFNALWQKKELTIHVLIRFVALFNTLMNELNHIFCYFKNSYIT